jgi:hypothetical protein
MTARIVRRLIRSLDAAGVIGVFCVLQDRGPDRRHAMPMPNYPF